jgi:hypothetical protein
MKPDLRVLCPECKATGLKSRVNPGMAMETCMGVDSYYDEEGRYHRHDPNITTQGFVCSNGHSWYTKTPSVCWCGKAGYSPPTPTVLSVDSR